jgi:uncharacterized membrane protein
MRYRNIVFVIVMSIVTFGIYDIYWVFSTRNELVKKHCNVPSPWLIFAPILGLIGVAFLQIAVHLLAVDNPDASIRVIANVISVFVGIVSVIGIIPLAIYWTWKYSQAVEKVTNKGLTAGFTFAMAMLLTVLGAGVLWPPIVQYQFNKVSKAT